MIKWSDDYLIGIEEIDNQHKKLFEIADRAVELLKNEYYIDKYDRIVEIIDELRDYYSYHFNYEEKYMLSIGYKRYFSQKVDHDDFIEKIRAIDLNEMDENQDEYLMSIIDFMIEWITDHIIQKDKLIPQA